jgi:hypothetical protein
VPVKKAQVTHVQVARKQALDVPGCRSARVRVRHGLSSEIAIDLFLPKNGLSVNQLVSLLRVV